MSAGRSPEKGADGAERRLSVVPANPGDSGADSSVSGVAAQGEAPRLSIVRGEPDDAELAALTVVLAAVSAAGAAEEPDTRGRSVWVDRAAMVRGPLHPGPGAWQHSVWPR